MNKALFFKGFIVSLTMICGVLLGGCSDTPRLNAYAENLRPAPVSAHQTRLGFSPWPADLTVEGVNRSYGFIRKHGNIISHHFDNGVPWNEALSGARFPAHLRNDWAGRKQRSPKGMPVFLSLTPINFGRTGLSPAWTAKGDNKPLSGKWRGKRFSDPEVKKAFTNYARRAVAYFKPKYLAIAIEANIIISKNPGLWKEFLELNAHVYRVLKKEHPRLPVFATVQYEHMRGIESDAKKNVHLQKKSIRQLMKHSDMMAVSTYRYGLYHPNPMKPGYFSIAESFGKPMAIAETGAMSIPIKIFGNRLDANEQDQRRFMSGLLAHAAKKKYAFVINWVSVDFDPMIKKLPQGVAEMAKAWVHNGLQTAEGKDKPALSVWRAYLKGYRGR